MKPVHHYSWLYVLAISLSLVGVLWLAIPVAVVGSTLTVRHLILDFLGSLVRIKPIRVDSIDSSEPAVAPIHP